MSGITPILDTLLHQVLGKRVDIPSQRELAEPVKPVWSAEGPRAVRSDSRLESRDASRLPTTPVTVDTADAQRGAETASRTDARAGAPPPALSPGARVISSLLARFPSSPSVLRAPEPLFDAAAAPSRDAVAERLLGAIRDSGLFYESQLARWYRGEVPRQQLERQPQMARWHERAPGPAPSVPQRQASTLPSAAAVAPLQSGSPRSSWFAGAVFRPVAAEPSPLTMAPGRGALVPTAAKAAVTPAAPGDVPVASSVNASPGSQAQGVWARAADASAGIGSDTALHRTDNDAPPSPARAGPVLDESLQSLVRHQLELLVTPTVRWEGDVWAGLFMALVVHLPDASERERGGEADRDHESDDWQSSMRLELPSLGTIRVSLAARDTRLRLTLAAREADTRARLAPRVDELRQRLVACGFSDTRVTLTAGSESDE